MRVRAADRDECLEGGSLAEEAREGSRGGRLLSDELVRQLAQLLRVRVESGSVLGFS